jgi:hypothetical protein
VASGSSTASFSGNVDSILITYADKACYISKESGSLISGSSGRLDGRIYVAEGTIGMTLPWWGNKIYVINAVVAETPTIHVIGLSS